MRTTNVHNILTQEDKIAIYLCSLFGVTTGDIAVRFERTPRYIRIICTEIETRIPHLKNALDLAVKIVKEIVDRNEQIHREQTVLLGDMPSPQRAPRPFEAAVTARTIKRLEQKA